MSERRLDPAALRARLAANLAADAPRGLALSASIPAEAPPIASRIDASTAMSASPEASSTGAALPVDAPVPARSSSSTPTAAAAVSSVATSPALSTAGPELRATPSEPSPPITRSHRIRSTSPSAVPADVVPSSPPAASLPPRAPRAGVGPVRSTATPMVATLPAVAHRHHEGAALRGYRIPADLHRRAERAKVAASSARGATLHWDEVMQAAIDSLPTDATDVREELDRVVPATFAPAGRAAVTGPTKVLQATLRHDQDLRLRLLRLDLEELTGRTVRLEAIWTLLAHRVVEEHLAAAR